MFYRSGWLRCVGLMSMWCSVLFRAGVGFRAGVLASDWCLTCGVILYITIIYYTYTVILSYTILFYSSSPSLLLSFSFPSIFCSSSPPSIIPFQSSQSHPSDPLIQSIRVGTSITLFIFRTHLPISSRFGWEYTSIFPILISFKVYVSVVTHGYLYSILIFLKF